MEFMMLGLFAVVAVAMLGISYFFASRRWRAWQQLADELGLQYIGDTVTGQLDGVPVELWTMSHGRRSRHRNTLTTLVAKLRPDSMPRGLEITREGLTSKLGKLVTGPDVQLGFSQLDDKLLVRADDEQEVRKWAESGQVAVGLEALLQSGENFTVEPDRVQLDLIGAIDDTTRLRPLLLLLAETAAKLGEPAETTSPKTPQQHLEEMLGG